MLSYMRGVLGQSLQNMAYADKNEDTPENGDKSCEKSDVAEHRRIFRDNKR